MKNQNGKIIEETFYLGSTHVTIINPNSFFPENVNDRTLSEFFYENDKNFKSLFDKLAKSSRDFYEHEHCFDLNKQKNTIKNYLKSNANKKIMADVGLSNKTVSELKNQKKELDLMSVKTFEKLYKCAVKAEKNAQ